MKDRLHVVQGGYHTWRLMTPISTNLIFPAPFEQLWRSVDKSGKGLSYMTFDYTNKHLHPISNSRTWSRELKYSNILQMSYMKFNSKSSLSHTPPPQVGHLAAIHPPAQCSLPVLCRHNGKRKACRGPAWRTCLVLIIKGSQVETIFIACTIL